MEFNLADLFEHAVDRFAERECLTTASSDADRPGVQRRTFAELDTRANRLAHHLVEEAGIRPGDRVGVYALNSAEWVESLLAVCKVRAVCVNVNYRYVTEELAYLLGKAEPRALIYQERYAERVAEVAPTLPTLRHLISIPDRRPTTSPAAVPYELALASGSPERDFPPRSPDDHYLLFTGGTTGLPKGVVWRQEDVFFALGGGIDVTNGSRVARPEDVVEQAYDNPITFFPVAPLMHGLTQWGLMQQAFKGNRAVLIDRFDPDRIWRLIGEEKINVLLIAGDAMGRPLVDALRTADEAGRPYDTSALFGIASSSALFSTPVKRAFLERFPQLYLSDAVGSSEGGADGINQGITLESLEKAEGVTTKPIGDAEVVDDDLRPLPAGVTGRLARRGNIPIGYLGDPEKTAEVFRTDAAGVRWSVPGDWARREADGRITLLGRGSACINSGGEKIFPEEVETAIKSHPAVYDTVVVGAPDERWGETVVAVIQPRDGAAELTLDTVQEHCRAHIAGYKLPRRLRVVEEVQRTPSGKPDMLWAKRVATEDGAAPG
ncbi:acyl-CoA synthetase [Phaeacidiphilus oryzae]|uniref:acyl-CoA synthetase n=1 Tax=Phaeacidiphilus oryzae TaxID=348818 RepID=UPI00056C45B4|nr:acyl-CoA synthetase [Phaeacidiphilus oryzae]